MFVSSPTASMTSELISAGRPPSIASVTFNAICRDMWTITTPVALPDMPMIPVTSWVASRHLSSLASPAVNGQLSIVENTDTADETNGPTYSQFMLSPHRAATRMA